MNWCISKCFWTIHIVAFALQYCIAQRLIVLHKIYCYDQNLPRGLCFGNWSDDKCFLFYIVFHKMWHIVTCIVFHKDVFVCVGLYSTDVLDCIQIVSPQRLIVFQAIHCFRQLLAFAKRPLASAQLCKNSQFVCARDPHHHIHVTWLKTYYCNQLILFRAQNLCPTSLIR